MTSMELAPALRPSYVLFLMNINFAHNWNFCTVWTESDSIMPITSLVKSKGALRMYN